MKRDTLLFALDHLETLGMSVPPESYQLAQQANVSSLAATDLMEAALFFYDWGRKEQRVRQRHDRGACART